MNQIEIKATIEKLIDTFLYAGEVSIELREKGLTKEIKEDNTPVSNGDLEVNKIITEKIKELTPDIPIISEESSENKLIKNLKNFWLIDPIDGTYDYINNKDWGIGQVQSIIKEKVTVNFENVGKKVINAKNIELEKLE